MKHTLATLCLLLAFSSARAAQNATDQQESLERRQPLELVFADSIVPQDRHEMMLTTGAWNSRRGVTRNASLTWSSLQSAAKSSPRRTRHVILFFRIAARRSMLDTAG
jgi:hypothetical protein